MDAFKGKYERTSADKYEEMLKELDVNFLLRKAATVSTPGVFLAKYSSLHRTFIAVCDITEEGGEWTIKTSTTLKTMELKFKVRDNRIIDLLAALDIIRCRIFPKYLNATSRV